MTATFRTSVHIDAAPTDVFRYLIDASAMVQWIGDHAVLDARPGGEFTLDIEGIPVRGEYVDVVEPERVVVSWGHAGSAVMPPSSTEVEFRLQPQNGGTLLSVEHRDLPNELEESHSVGWPMFLGKLQGRF